VEFTRFSNTYHNLVVSLENRGYEVEGGPSARRFNTPGRRVNELQGAACRVFILQDNWVVDALE